ncbi:MAG: DUF2513 domain-containing protein, partial [Methylocella sp.]
HKGTFFLMKSNLRNTVLGDSNKQENENMISPSYDGLEDEMKRDMNFIRDLLLKIEEFDPKTPAKKPSSDELLPANPNEADCEKLSEHLLKLINEAKLVSGISATSRMGAMNWTELRLTWKGDDFIALVRNSEIWEEAKNAVDSAGSDFSLDLLMNLAEGIVRKRIEKNTGIKLT